jgi:hypothetical protein
MHQVLFTTSSTVIPRAANLRMIMTGLLSSIVRAAFPLRPRILPLVMLESISTRLTDEEYALYPVVERKVEGVA